MDATWSGPEPGRLVAAPLDSLTAIHDRRSGQTHLVAEPIPQVLSTLELGPATAAGLLERLAALYALEGDERGALIVERLEELAALGLVERR